jgi:hypothetical protein
MFDSSHALTMALRGEFRSLDQEFLGHIATVVLLGGAEGELLAAAVDGLVRSRFLVDEALVRRLYWSAPRRARPTIAAAAPVAYIEPAEYARMWSDALRASSDGEERLRLARTLHGFLVRNPSEAHRFVRPIRNLLHEKAGALKDVGLLLLGTLHTPTAADLAHVGRALSSAPANTRLAALGAVQRWLICSEMVAPQALALAFSKVTVMAAREATQHFDGAVRAAARNYLRILRKRTTGKVPPGRVPRLRHTAPELLATAVRPNRGPRPTR